MITCKSSVHPQKQIENTCHKHMPCSSRPRDTHTHESEAIYVRARVELYTTICIFKQPCMGASPASASKGCLQRVCFQEIDTHTHTHAYAHIPSHCQTQQQDAVADRRLYFAHSDRHVGSTTPPRPASHQTARTSAVECHHPLREVDGSGNPTSRSQRRLDERYESSCRRLLRGGQL